MSKEFKAHRPKTAKPLPKKAETVPKVVSEGEKPDPRDPKTWPKEVGGPEGPEPTRYGDWERKGICSDF